MSPYCVPDTGVDGAHILLRRDCSRKAPRNNSSHFINGQINLKQK